MTMYKEKIIPFQMVKDKQNLDQFESENGEKFGKNRVRNKMRTHTNT